MLVPSEDSSMDSDRLASAQRRAGRAWGIGCISGWVAVGLGLVSMGGSVLGLAPDLNLLLTLDVLLAEGSVAAAARRLRLSLSLSLSPSAMSRTLARLRETTGDPLLVRAGRGLVPTPHAIALREHVGPRCPRRAPALGAKARQGQRAPAPGQRGPGDRRAGKNHGP